MTNAIHADEKQSREGLLFGLDRGRASCPLDCLRKRGRGFYGFYGGGAAHKNRKAPRSFEDMVFTKNEKPVNLLNLLNL